MKARAAAATMKLVVVREEEQRKGTVVHYQCYRVRNEGRKRGRDAELGGHLARDGNPWLLYF
eukprot:2899482-Rhodomonas_salina.1